MKEEMIAELQIPENMVKLAVKQYLERQGWDVKSVDVRGAFEPDDGPRPGRGAYTTCSAKVAPKAPTQDYDPQRG